ncbi:MAG TPA: glycosyltransferase family 4 protein [Gemmatimonadales bacterium]|nr:glycosyltransferase family 4 protein [Gemmatimonadales bacterium]
MTPSRFFTSYGHPIRVLGQVQALARQGVSVTICTYGHGEDLPGFVIHRVPLTPRGLPPGWNPARIYLDPALGMVTAREALRRTYDLIHAHIFDGAAAAMAAKWMRGAPLLADLQDSVSELLESSRRSRLLVALARTVERVVMRVADHVVTSSRHLEGLLRHRFGLPETRVSSLLDAVDTTLYDPARWDRRQTRSSLGFQPDDVVIAYTGTLSARQGADVLFEMVSQAAAQRLPWRFLICGTVDAAYQPILRKFIDDKRIAYLGVAHYLRDMPQLLSAADIGVSPKRVTTEGNGKLLHYMATSLPVVALDSEPNRELLGVDASYVQDDQPAAWFEALRHLADDPDRRRRMGERLRARVTREFSWDVRIESLMRVYARLRSAGKSLDAAASS